MKHRLKGLLALVLSLTMVLSMVVTVSATATEYNITANTVTNVSSALSGVAEVSGTDGNVTIKLTSNVNGRIHFGDNTEPSLTGTFVLDLNGYTIDAGTADEALCLDNDFSGTVTVVGNGSLKKGNNNIIYKGSSATLKFDVSDGYDYFTLKKDGVDVFANEENTSATSLNGTYFTGTALVLTQEYATPYPVSIGGVSFNEFNLTIDSNDITGVTGTATYDPINKILTLDNFSGTSLSISESMKINLEGSNTVADTTSATSGGAAVVVRGDLTITSENNGSLNATSANNYGIYAANTLSFDKANVSVGCTIGLVANKIYINESTVTIDADSTAISCSELAFGSGWQYQWTSDAAVPMGNVAFDLATYNTNSTAYLKFASYTTTSTPTPPSGGYYPVYIPTPEEDPEKVEAANTFDGGIALSVAVTILSATGSAYLAKKRED